MKTSLRRNSLLYAWYELLSSMRFAVGLLSILAIASIVGTVLKQNEPYANYAFEFGPFWFEIFQWLGFYDVYSSAGFLSILAFLVVSISLCVLRNGPGFIKEMKGFREKASDKSLAAFKHSTSFTLEHPQLPAAQAYLKQQGFRFKERQREDGSLVLAAKKGTASKLGYFFAHIAIVVICVGGLIDGNLPIKLGELTGNIVAETRNIPQSQIPAVSRLTSNNLSYRGNVSISEGKSADVTFLGMGNGYLVQELPFVITLKKFRVDYYSNGMPKLFASDIVITDKVSQKVREATVKVNHPLVVDGVAIYQASFGDGGSPLTFKAWNLAAPALAPVEIKAVSMANQPLKANGQNYTLELGELRVFNVSSIADPKETDTKTFGQRMQDAREVKQEKQLRNQGPTIGFKLRDNRGQAVEFLNYMVPIQQDGASYLMTGIRKKVGQDFEFVRLPMDENQQLDRFMRLRAAVQNPALYDEIVQQTTKKARQGEAFSPQMEQQFSQSIRNVLERFAQGGLRGLDQFLSSKVPADQRQAVAQTYIKLLQGTIIDTMEVADRHAGIKPRVMDEAYYRFLMDSLMAMTGLHEYPAPVLLQLDNFEHIQSSGLQITRSPGKNLVYLGSLLLVIGIFLMFYVRELRLWLSIHGQEVRVAMSSNRHNRDLDNDFARHSDALQQLLRGS